MAFHVEIPISLAITSELHFPQKCVYCLQPSTKTYDVSIRDVKLKDMYESKLGMILKSIPYCDEHYEGIIRHQKRAKFQQIGANIGVILGIIFLIGWSSALPPFLGYGVCFGIIGVGMLAGLIVANLSLKSSKPGNEHGLKYKLPTTWGEVSGTGKRKVTYTQLELTFPNAEYTRLFAEENKFPARDTVLGVELLDRK